MNGFHSSVLLSKVARAWLHDVVRVNIIISECRYDWDSKWVPHVSIGFVTVADGCNLLQTPEIVINSLKQEIRLRETGLQRERS